nr:BrnA antitoxin family protein [Treponema socranskii]
MKTMTLDELVKNPLTEEDKKIINSAKPLITEDCPEMTTSQLKNFKPWYEVHPNRNNIYKVSVKKTAINLRIDNDVFAALKATGKDYQTKINNILRKAVLG